MQSYNSYFLYMYCIVKKQLGNLKKKQKKKKVNVFSWFWVAIPSDVRLGDNKQVRDESKLYWPLHTLAAFDSVKFHGMIVTVLKL